MRLVSECQCRTEWGSFVVGSFSSTTITEPPRVVPKATAVEDNSVRDHKSVYYNRRTNEQYTKRIIVIVLLIVTTYGNSRTAYNIVTADDKSDVHGI